jgi:hypothetical protein
MDLDQTVGHCFHFPILIQNPSQNLNPNHFHFHFQNH